MRSLAAKTVSIPTLYTVHFRFRSWFRSITWSTPRSQCPQSTISTKTMQSVLCFNVSRNLDHFDKSIITRRHHRVSMAGSKMSRPSKSALSKCPFSQRHSECTNHISLWHPAGWVLSVHSAVPSLMLIHPVPVRRVVAIDPVLRAFG